MSDLFFDEALVQRVVSICLPVGVDRCFDYIVPPEMEVLEGAYVRVSFSNREVIGIVWGQGERDINPAKLKPIMEVLTHLPPISEALRSFLSAVATYNCAPLGNTLKLSMPAMQAIASPESEEWLEEVSPAPALRMTQTRKKILDYIRQQGAASREALRDQGASVAVIRGLLSEGALRPVQRHITYVPSVLQPEPQQLTASQQQAVDEMNATCDAGFSATLLDGATGSGKTEVFFEVAQQVMSRGKQVLFLVPEIALTMQLVARVKARFGVDPTIWHSSQTPAKRRQALRQVMHGGTQLIIGARSALFLPFQSLGLIVVDEEHDSSFKQEDGVMYHGRDMALLRARKEHIPVILTSATPSLETVVNVHTNKYRLVHIVRRDGQAPLPSVELIDMRKEAMEKQSWISPSLRQKLQDTLDQGRQSLLFINRRGYAPLVLCRACGHRYECPSCSAWLVYHAANRNLQCHHCGLSTNLPPHCPSCGADKEKLAACGPGVERIEEEVQRLFPQATTQLLSGELSQSPHALQEALEQVSSGKVDIVIGTQLLAKGHHFPLLTTVGVVDADAGLQGGDIRGSEKTYQMLHQLSGRAGREAHRGSVFIQTYRPEHALMQALMRWDREGFVELELQHRRMGGMPPYGRLAALIVEGKPESLVEAVVAELAKHKPSMQGVHILGPAPAPMYKLRNLYRHRFLVVAPKRAALQAMMMQWKHAIKRSPTVSIRIDIDPVNFM